MVRKLYRRKRKRIVVSHGRKLSFDRLRVAPHGKNERRMVGCFTLCRAELPKCPRAFPMGDSGLHDAGRNPIRRTLQRENRWIICYRRLGKVGNDRGNVCFQDLVRDADHGKGNVCRTSFVAFQKHSVPTTGNQRHGINRKSDPSA